VLTSSVPPANTVMNASASLNQTAVGKWVDDLPVTEFPRILYDKNPLELVICQLRFPPILKIETELPSAFQEAVRSQFPLFNDARQQVGFAGLPPELSKLLGAMLPTPVPRTYEFTSSDGAWQITLTRESLALTCRKYRRWEEFRSILANQLGALMKYYAPAFFNRIGLRYRDMICRSELGLADVSWNELLRADLAGEFHSPIASNIKLASHQLVLSLSHGKAQVLIQHGISPRTTDQEICYYIDNDFSTEQGSEPNDAMETLDYFSKHSWRLFRWCIGDRLHNAMGPRPIEPRTERDRTPLVR
jgi:uncharacterized protein (TIGR04255 family)